jgi:NAD(P)-dependent dehydrogenase (short-subunit alcohol dehydrogenase family)
LILAARGAEALAAAERECVDAGAAAALTVPVDVGDAAAVDDLFDTAIRTFGRVDAVVHAAAVLAFGRFTDVPREVFDRVIVTNLLGTANVARAALRQFDRQAADSTGPAGRLVLVGSRLGQLTLPMLGAYVAGKWGMHGLARVLQQELRDRPGVEVCLVAPDSVNTPIYRTAANYTGRRGRPIPPVLDPDRVARAVVRAVERPRRERHVGLAGGLAVLVHRHLQGTADVVAGPVVRWTALSRRSIDRGSGNVFDPTPGPGSTRGEWPTRRGRLMKLLARGTGRCTCERGEGR